LKLIIALRVRSRPMFDLLIGGISQAKNSLQKISKSFLTLTHAASTAG